MHFFRTDSQYAERFAEKFNDASIEPCPVYLLTGEYDYSCRPENSQATAARIEGAQCTIMEKLGHFPMSENPEQFRPYIHDVLSRIY